MDLLVTGIKEIDDRIFGGFPRSQYVLVFGDVGVGKGILCRQILYNALIRGEYGIYFTLRNSPGDVRNKMGYFGWDTTKFEEEGSFIIVDGYSGLIGREEIQNSDAEYVIDDPTNLIRVSKVMDEVLDRVKGHHFLVLVDDLTTLLYYVETKELLRHIMKFKAKLKRLNGINFYILHEKALDPQTVAQIESIMDSLVEVRYVEKERLERQLRIKSMIGKKPLTYWFLFEITDYGIEISRLI